MIKRRSHAFYKYVSAIMCANVEGNVIPWIELMRENRSDIDTCHATENPIRLTSDVIIRRVQLCDIMDILHRFFNQVFHM